MTDVFEIFYSPGTAFREKAASCRDKVRDKSKGRVKETGIQQMRILRAESETCKSVKNRKRAVPQLQWSALPPSRYVGVGVSVTRPSNMSGDR